MDFSVERRDVQVARGTPVEEAVIWAFNDAESQKLGEQTG